MNSFLEKVCKEKNLNIAKADNKEIYTIMGESNNTLNISMENNRISSYILKENNDIIEQFDMEYAEDTLDDILSDTVDTFTAINDIKDGDGELEILNEEGEDDVEVVDENGDVEEVAEKLELETDIFSPEVDVYNELSNAKTVLKDLGNKLKNINVSDESLSMILLDIAHNTLSLSLDVESAMDTLSELDGIQEPINSSKDLDTENAVNETQARIDITKSVLAARHLEGINKISSDDLKLYEDTCKDVFNGKRLDEDTIQTELSLDNNVKEIYHGVYDTDDMWEDINDDVTFKDVLDSLQDKDKDFYDVIGVGDSVVRERVFEILVDILNHMGEDVDYGDIYEMFLENSN